MSNHFYLYMVNILPILFCCLVNLQAISPSKPLTSVRLPDVHGSQTISEEFLINLEDNFSIPASSVNWVDNNNIIYILNDKITLFDVESHHTTYLVDGSSPQVSPNCQWIAYVADGLNGKQVWLMKSNGSEKRKVTHLKDGLAGTYNYHYGFAWSFDSNQLAIYINPITPVTNELVQSLPPSRIYVINIKNDIAKELYSDHALIGDLSWYSNNEKLLMSKLVSCRFYKNQDEEWSYVQSVSVSDGGICVLAKFNGLQQQLHPQLSPDNSTVSMLYNAENDLFDWMLSLGLVASEQVNSEMIPRPKQLTFDMKLAGFKWSKEGHHIFMLRKYGAYNQIYTVDIKSSEVKQITNDPLNINKLSLSPDGSKLLYKGMDAHGRSIIRIASADGNRIENLIVVPNCKDDIALGEVREIEWDTINYPSKMRGLLCLPLNYKKGVKYPLVVDIHGGGSGASIYLNGGVLMNSPLEWQLWTSKGYAVFIPEFRSSAAFGYLAILRDDLQEHDIVNCDMIDVIAGVDELIKQGIVDNNRLAAIGHSAGGRRVNWLTVSTNRFRVVISKEGWADEWALAMKHPLVWKFFGGSPLDVPENYLKNSALFYSKNATTPTLFLMGNPKLGGADPENTVRTLYESLKKQGIETEYVEYLDEGHNFIMPENQRDALRRAVQWIDYYTREKNL